ncbi:hypothetical protein BC832DRAFT_588596 [Gaertneriomyces semiglobifer]|nr:hypothetical protein BC832DRAFT_588596 [Gaertneriomyces semiglobifer]
MSRAPSVRSNESFSSHRSYSPGRDSSPRRRQFSEVRPATEYRRRLSRPISVFDSAASVSSITKPRPPPGSVVEAVYDYRGTSDTELDFSAGDRFQILTSDTNDWWLVKGLGNKNVQGYIPANYVQVIEQDALAAEKPVAEDEPQNSEEDVAVPDQGLENTSSEDDSEDQDSSDSSDALSDNDSDRALSERSRSVHQKKKMLRKPSRRRLAPPISVRGWDPLPQGFRLSTLAKAQREGIGSLRKTLAPKMTADGIAFKDIAWDVAKQRIRKRAVSCTLAFSLLDARNVPLPGSHIRIVGRVVRMALFDKNSILSNIHSVPAVYNPDFETIWKFSDKASLLFQRDHRNTCFVRVNEVDANLSILFELCVIVEREGKADMGTEQLSCGWGVLPLFTHDGGPIENKSYEVKLWGGTPFERNVRLEEQLVRPGMFQSLFSANKSPRLNLRVWKLGRSVIRRLNRLPDTIISFLYAAPLLSMYRRLLAETLVSPERTHGTVVTYAPILALLPVIAEHHDLFMMLVAVWERSWKSMGCTEKRLARSRRRAFTEALMAVWPLLHVQEMPQDIPGDVERTKVRRGVISRFEEAGVLDSLSRGSTQFSLKPFDVHELRFDFLAAAQNPN